MTQLSTQFNYGSLDAESRIVVQQKTNEIRERIKRTASDIVEIGERLIEVKNRLPHGEFGRWLEIEFEWSDQTALNFINVAKNLGDQIPNGLEYDARAIYLLASGSTPPAVRDSIIADAKPGTRITHKEVKSRIEAAKPPAPKPPASKPMPPVRPQSPPVPVPAASSDYDEPDYDEQGFPIRPDGTRYEMPSRQSDPPKAAPSKPFLQKSGTLDQQSQMHIAINQCKKLIAGISGLKPTHQNRTVSASLRELADSIQQILSRIERE